MANDEAQRLSDHELFLQSIDQSNYPFISMRGLLYWTGSAWAKWDGLNSSLTSVGTDSLDVNIIGGATSEVQYTEGDTDATITGTAVMWEDAANTLVAVSATKPLPVEITDASIAVTGTFWQATQPVSGTFWQATQPVSATDLDIRDLTATDVVTAEIKPLATCSSGANTVANAGTAEALGASTAIDSVTIKALSTNTDLIYVGDSGVDSTNGFQLSAGDSISLDVDNLTDVYIDSAVNGEGVTYIYVT